MYLHFMKFVEVDMKAVLMRDVLIRVPWVLIAQVQSYVSTFRDCMRDILSLVSSPSPSNAWEKQLKPLKELLTVSADARVIACVTFCRLCRHHRRQTPGKSS